MPVSVDSAVVIGEGSTEYNALLHRVHDAMATGSAAPAQPRPVIADSWRRVRSRGIRIDRNSAATSLRVPHIGQNVERLRALFPLLLPHAQPLIDDGMTMLVLTDADGTIVDTAGRGRTRTQAEKIGFLPAHSWAESAVGTNAIGTALVAKQPVAVHGAEHYLTGQHGWSCAAAPIRDPWTGVVLGAVDFSLPVDQAHPVLLALASSIARTAGLEIASAHRKELDQLRARAVAATRGITEPWIVVDRMGWVADSYLADARRRLALPEGMSDGEEWVAPIGASVVEQVDGGWLIRAQSDRSARDAMTFVEIRPSDAGAQVLLLSGERRRTVDVTPRQADILMLLARTEHGLTAAELSARLYGTPERDVTVRAEISRLRRSVGTLLAAAPYRFAPGVVAEVASS